MRYVTKVAALAAGVVAALAFAGPANAQTLPAEPWLPLDTSGPAFTQSAAVNTHVVNPTTVHLEADADDPDSKGTSVETLDLGLAVQAQQQISFRYELRDGATCAGGAPRVFVEISGTFVNSWDQLQPAGQQCGTDGLVTFTATQNGEIGAAGVVYDSGAGGAVRVADLTVNGQLVLFAALCEWDAELAATDDECQPPASPTPTPTATGPAAAGKGGSDADVALPVTGASVPLFMAAGAGLLGLGGGLAGLAWWSSRRRRNALLEGLTE